MSDAERETAFNALVDWTVDDKQSFCVVENPTFQHFLDLLNPSFNMPSRRTLVRGITDAYNSRRVDFMRLLGSVPGRVALTCDGWSSRVMRGYFNVSIHWIDSSFTMRSAVLEFVYFPPPHNQGTTSDLLKDILIDYEMPKKVKSITTDSGGEMPPAMRKLFEWLFSEYGNDDDLDECHLRCVCHIINRSVKDCEAIIKPEVEKVRCLVKAVRNSVAMRHECKLIQVRLGWRDFFEVPNLDVDTRWNTMFLMIDAAFKFRDVFSALCNSDKFRSKIQHLNLSAIEWDELKDVKDFLQPAFSMTESASGRYATLSMQPLIYDQLREHCLDTITAHAGVLYFH